MAGTGITWEWVLPEAVVRASMDGPRRAEAVWVGPHLVAHVAAGSMPGGHETTLPSGQPIKVVFDPATPACALFLGGTLVPPTRVIEPKKTKGIVFVGVGVAALFGIVLFGLALVAVVRGFRAGAAGPHVKPSDYVLSQTYASPDGALVAHFPQGFTGKLGKGEAGRYVSVEVARSGGTSNIGLVAIFNPISTDLPSLDATVQGGVTSAWKEAGMTWKQASHHDGVCLGQPAAITEGLLEKYFIRLKTWQCTFFRGGEAFHFFYLRPEGGDAEEATVLDKIIEATEIHATH